ncbi:MAG TPA: metallopeptidase family protein [Opitutaceae bacterium]|nr:metallopeptidase family protein [Opitutaceae bacterium]
MNISRLTALAAETVASTQRALPSDVRTLALALPVSYEPVPGEALRDDGCEPDLLGLFVGPSHAAAQSADVADVPPQILLFLENLWDYAGEDVKEFCEEVRLTYLHELGHYLGWDEDDLARRGLD